MEEKGFAKNIVTRAKDLDKESVKSEREDTVGMAPADCWNWGEWGLKEYKWEGGSFLGWFAGLVVPVQ